MFGSVVAFTFRTLHDDDDDDGDDDGTLNLTVHTYMYIVFNSVYISPHYTLLFYTLDSCACVCLCVFVSSMLAMLKSVYIIFLGFFLDSFSIHSTKNDPHFDLSFSSNTICLGFFVFVIKYRFECARVNLLEIYF